MYIAIATRAKFKKAINLNNNCSQSPIGIKILSAKGASAVSAEAAPLSSAEPAPLALLALFGFVVKASLAMFSFWDKP